MAILSNENRIKITTTRNVALLAKTWRKNTFMSLFWNIRDVTKPCQSLWVAGPWASAMWWFILVEERNTKFVQSLLLTWWKTCLTLLCSIKGNNGGFVTHQELLEVRLTVKYGDRSCGGLYEADHGATCRSIDNWDVLSWTNATLFCSFGWRSLRSWHPWFYICPSLVMWWRSCETLSNCRRRWATHNIVLPLDLNFSLDGFEILNLFINIVLLMSLLWRFFCLWSVTSS